MGRSKQHKCLGPRRRRLDGDEGTVFVRCRVCGDQTNPIDGFPNKIPLIVIEA
jgi:hypothetical protein